MGRNPWERWGTVHSHFCLGKNIVPKVAFRVGNTKQLLHGLLRPFRLPILLGMVSRSTPSKNVQDSTDLLPDVEGNPCVAIRVDTLRQPMQSHHIMNNNFAVSEAFSDLLLGTRCTILVTRSIKSNTASNLHPCRKTCGSPIT